MVKGKLDICLVNPPYADVVRPSLGLGLLQARLARAGLRTATVYANLLFWERVGMFAYDFASVLMHSLGEWTFSGVAFPELAQHQDESAERRYQDLILSQRDRATLRVGRKRIVATMWALRREAEEFTDELCRHILEMGPRIVGCSTTFMGHVAGLALLRRLREMEPGIITLMGGANCEGEMGISSHRNFPWVDYVVSGEADDFIVPLARALLAKGRDLDSRELPYGVLGPCHRRGGYPAPPPRASARDLDRLPRPDFDDYFNTLEKLPVLKEVVRPSLPVEGSRGCWWAQRHPCRFCGLNGRGRAYRRKSAGRLLEEMDQLHQRHGLRNFRLVDNTLDLRQLRHLLPELKRRGAPYRLFCDLRPSLKRDQLRLLVEAGFRAVQIGFENLDSGVLRRLGKGSTGWQNLRVLKWCREFGLHVSWVYLYDVPGEDPSWYRRAAELIPLITHLQPPIMLSPVRFNRFSPYHDQPERFGLDLRLLSCYQHIYPLPPEQMQSQAYYFEDRHRPEGERYNGPRLSSIEGFSELQRAVTHWQTLYHQQRLPRLEALSLPDGSLEIADTRPVARQPRRRLKGLAARLYRACLQAPRQEHIFQNLGRQGAHRRHLDELVDEFLELGWLYRMEGRLLALACQGPVRKLTPENRFPGGMVDKLLYAALCHVGLAQELPPAADASGAASQRV